MKIADERDKLKARNKELESDLYSANCIISEQIDIIRDSIPKSKVKEKIEELEMKSKKETLSVSFWVIQSKIRVLQELLEE